MSITGDGNGGLETSACVVMKSVSPPASDVPGTMCLSWMDDSLACESCVNWGERSTLHSTPLHDIHTPIHSEYAHPVGVAHSRDIDQSDLICDLEARSMRPEKVGDAL